jgi:apolipoprotein N-acyltransferase
MIQCAYCATRFKIPRDRSLILFLFVAGCSWLGIYWIMTSILQFGVEGSTVILSLLIAALPAWGLYTVIYVIFDNITRESYIKTLQRTHYPFRYTCKHCGRWHNYQLDSHSLIFWDK